MHSKGEVETSPIDVDDDSVIGCYFKNDPRADINKGWALAACRGSEREANAERIAALWNAADGMTTEQAVKYITHGREMVEWLKMMVQNYDYKYILESGEHRRDIEDIKDLLAKLDKEDDNKCLAGLTQAEREKEDTCGNGDCAHEANCTLI